MSMDRPKLEVADIFRRYGKAYREKHGASMSTAQRRVMTAIEVCRTAALGGQIEQCDQCGHQRICYRSCRNRHCPKCQSLARAEWIQRRQAELLDCEYFHVVFTVPEEIAAIAYQNKEVVYNILFRATAETLRTIAADPKHLGAEIGFFAVLHTWGSNLLHHPHLHCVSPVAASRPTAPTGSPEAWFLFARARVVALVPPPIPGASPKCVRCRQTAILQYSGKSLGSPPVCSLPGASAKSRMGRLCQGAVCWPQQVLDYVGRYTHRVAISNNRLLDIEASQVRFQWKDYRDKGQQKSMTLSVEEFIRRFLLHALPDGLQRIRYYGLLGNRYRQQKLARCRQLLGMAPPVEAPAPADYRDQHEQLTGSSLRVCPVCHRGRMVMVEIVTAHRSPAIKDTS